MALYDSDREVLRQVLQWQQQQQQQQQRIALVTVARTWGSSPRPAGSLLAMREDGRFVGSVSGGCIEEDLVGRYCRGELSEALPVQIGYGVDRADAVRHGLPCGGRLQLLVERFDDGAHAARLLAAIDTGKPLRRRVDLSDATVTLTDAGADAEFVADEVSVSKVFGPLWQMLLIGAGELARYVASMALMLGYKVTVCDPRDETTDGWAVEGVDLIRSMPDDAVRELVTHPASVVLTLAHDPKVDDMALMQALESPAVYIGALGSRRTSASRRERLASLGIAASDLDWLHAPVGLPIGSRTPAEIAVSILAGVTAARRGVSA